ncbi:hypothetical protein SDC9_111126 [bioreactor metagenome]|uniref:Uncharacterized protein n=1 Tax=bioreactor metagenome TaxID=1076179 RepID=A0A645BFM2_9ZZZZ|nr:hypothetical protein [Candidatus Pelethousia sp.]
MGWILIGFALVTIIDLVPLVRRRKKGGIAAFAILFCLGLTLSLLQTAGVPIPSILLALGDLFKAAGLNYPS